jgi:flagellar assembly factor FliW
MPQILTKYFGTIDYDDENVIRFPSGLPSFEEESRFLVIAPADRAPLVFLQSMRQPGLCFLTLPILVIDPHYHLEMTAQDLESIELDTGRQPAIREDVECLAVLVAPEDGPPSANLLAPIVINRRTRLGTQAVRLDSVYSHQHQLASPEDTCS